MFSSLPVRREKREPGRNTTKSGWVMPFFKATTTGTCGRGTTVGERKETSPDDTLRCSACLHGVVVVPGQREASRPHICLRQPPGLLGHAFLQRAQRYQDSSVVDDSIISLRRDSRKRRLGLRGFLLLTFCVIAVLLLPLVSEVSLPVPHLLLYFP